MHRVILGGGLGGLSAGHYLLKLFPKEAVTIIESSDRTGGWIKSDIQRNGSIFEQGPRTIRPSGEAGQNTLELLQELNLNDNIRPIPSNHPAALNRMIYANGKLHSLPSSLKSLFARQDPFSKPLFMYFLNDLFAKKKPSNDESIYEFVKRRLGIDVADFLISPMICGICAGNAKEISVKFLMEKFFDYEQIHGSILKGIIKNSLANRNKKEEESKIRLIKRAKNERWSVYSFEDGMETLPEALLHSVKFKGGKIELNSPAKQISFDKEVTIETSNETVKAKHLIASIPSNKLGELLEESQPELSKLLKEIPYVTVGVVNLSFDRKLIDREGFGFLIAPRENLPVLGVIYDSCCFPCGDNTNLTVMMGGFWFEKYFGKNPEPDYLLKTALKQLRNILGISQEPVEYKVNILKDCIAQYTVGHKERIAHIEDYIRKHALPLSICGASYYGVGVNDVILSAKKAVLGLKILKS